MQTWVQEHPDQKLPVAFDSWYTQPAFCHFLSSDLGLNYVGALPNDAQVLLKTGLERVDALAARLKQEHLEAVQQGKPPVFKTVTIEYKGKQEVYYSYCMTHHIHNFGKHRLVTPALAAQVQVSIIARPIYLTTLSSCFATACSGMRRGSPVSIAIAGPWKSITRKARSKGWTSINCGISKRLRDTSPWSPWSTAC